MFVPFTWLAQAPAPAAGRPWHVLLLDNALGITLLFVFLVAVVGALVALRKRDRCLKRLRGYPVTALDQAGRAIWGDLRVFSNGIELVYRRGESPVPPEAGDRERAAPARPEKRSFLLYQPELAKLLTITRYVDQVAGTRAADRRLRQLRRMARPGPLTRAGRKARNAVNILRDALVTGFGMVMAQAQKVTKSRAVTAGGGQFTALGTTLIGEAGQAYEPMLEQYFGREVVAELSDPAAPDRPVVELAGFLGEYSPGYLLLVDCTRTAEEEITLPEDRGRPLAQWIRAECPGSKITVRHDGRFPARVTRLRRGDAERALDVDLPPGGSATVPLESPPAEGETIHLAIETTRTFDFAAPRTVCAVRHRANFGSAEPGAA